MTFKKSFLLATAFILLLIGIIATVGTDRVILASPNEQSGTSTSTLAYTDWWDYTVDYVDRAIDLYDQRGLEAMRDYYNSEASFEGEWYLFAIDENDIYVVHPIFPRLIGTDIKEVVDSTGYELGKDIAKATEEGRRIEYLWPHPVTRIEAPKVAYAKRHDGYVFASGYYPVPGEPAAYTQGYVQEAIDLYDSDGLDATVAHYNSRDSLDNQWYLILASVDDETLLAHGLSPNLLGADVTDLTDPEGLNIGQALLDATEDGYWFQMAFPRGTEAGFTRIRVWAVRHDGYIFASGYFTGEVASPTPTPTATATSVPTPSPTPEPINVDEVIAENPFGLLVAILSDAHENGYLSDTLSGLLVNLFIDSFITVNTDETREEVVYRVAVEGPAADRAALVALYNATDGPNWEKSDNWLSDEPLSEWFGITTDFMGRVTEVELDANNLRGTLPAELGNLSRLTNLNLRSNPLNGQIPAELGNLSNLRTLRLYGANLSGEIPGELANLTNLETLMIWSNDLSGPIPAWLDELTNLRRLDLDDNNFTGPIPAELGNLTELEVLWMSGNNLTGPIPPELGNLGKLQVLFAHDNSLSGPIPSELGDLDQLEVLYLQDNELSGEIPPELGDLELIERMYLRSNKLSGEIPAELGNLANLEVLHLADNDLSGEIPAELGNLDNLAWLLLYENGLTGPIPSGLSRLANLEGLFLRSNELSGLIPAELGDLPDLEILSLRNNQLNGVIPAELGNLANLESLTVSDNQLTGIIPAELVGLTELSTLLVSGNDLTGCIPAALENVRHNDFEDLDPPLPFCEPESESSDIEQLTTESAFETLISSPSKSIDTR
ncbi:MAG: cache domain-containing protein [Dehalococcoidia bacterium]|nr:cache domain-containing protein [Dehalococcoidia bacterium]